MILVTGGSGFIGSHVVRALTRLGEGCILVQRSSSEVPPHLAGLLVSAARGDVTDLESLREIGRTHKVTGIVHLAGYPDPRAATQGVGPTEELLRGLLNVVRVGSEWGVRRVSIASTIGVYAGASHGGILREDLPLPLTAPHAIPRWKKTSELLGEQLAESTGLEIVALRISGTWGPKGHEDPFFAAPALVHAAAFHRPLDLTGLVGQPTLGDGLDLSYVKDTGRAIALLQVADHLTYRTYNVATGRVTTNADIIAALERVAPGVSLALPDGATSPGVPLDITRLRHDTGFQPEYDTDAAAADYVAWLRSGNNR